MLIVDTVYWYKTQIPRKQKPISVMTRMTYVKQMSKYIDIDIYGKCGKYTCDDNKDCKKQLSGSCKNPYL
jgi:hypothetical protein